MVELFPLWNKERWDTRNRGTDFCLNKHCHITTFQCGSLECFHCDPMEKPKFHWQHLYLVQVKSSKKKKKEQLEEGKITFFFTTYILHLIFLFFQNFIIFYWLCYYNYPNFSLCPTPPSTPHSLRQSPTIVHVHGSCV